MLSLENMELKLSMVLNLIMPTLRAGVRTRAQVPCELWPSPQILPDSRGLAALKANPREGDWEPRQEPE